jgi:2-polyprenyl-3-methyl-5-hydroxy-6-metoxy-1,4-benzoquinol methylase
MKFKIVPENLIERIALLFNLAPTPLIDTQVSFNSARAIMAASNLGIFEAIGKTPKTVAQIAKDTNTDLAAVKHLLDSLVGQKYLRWNNGTYSLRPKYYKWLLKEYPSNLLGKLRFQNTEWNWMSHLEEYVRTGKIIDFHAALSKDEWSNYQDGMRDLSISAAKELASKLHLSSNVKHMLDIGGSHGMFSIELCRKHPMLHSTILELPEAVDRASSIASQQQPDDRVKYKTGNALTDDLGEQQYDLVLICNLVHHFTPEENKTLALKVAKALKPGAMYAIGEFTRLQKPGAGDVVSATLDLFFALTSSSGTWSVEEIQSWQTGAGLKPLKPLTLLSLPGWKMITAVR